MDWPDTKYTENCHTWDDEDVHHCEAVRPPLNEDETCVPSFEVVQHQVECDVKDGVPK